MSINKTDTCQLCGSKDGFTHNDYQDGFGDVFDCTECGKYIIEAGARSDFKMKKVRSSMYYYLRNIHKGNNKPLFVCKNDITSDEYQIITVDNLLKFYPQNTNERIDKILENLYMINQGFGSFIYLEANYICNSSIFFIDCEDGSCMTEVYNTIKILNKLELIKSQDRPISYFIIDFKGWERLDKINQQKIKTKKVFIAMWFSEEMLPFRKAIKEAIEETKYIPIIIDEKEHNNQIVPEILYEIRTSDFIVADLTGSRNGVYYEAGYALGLGKDVIFLFKNSEDESPHFDVDQQNQIRYKEPDDLKEKLKRRIIATI